MLNWKRIIFIGLLILLLILLGIGGYFVWKNIQAKKAAGEEITLRDYFPFGKGSGFLTQLGIGNTTDNENTDNQGDDTVIQEGRARLRKVTDNPVAGFTTLIKEVPLDPDEIPEPVVKTVTPFYEFKNDLKFGDKNPEVKQLQKTLNLCKETQLGRGQKTYGAPGQETEIFNRATLDSMIRFQTRFKAEILTPQGFDEATGILDEKTREIMNKPFSCEPEAPSKATTIKKAVVRYIERANANIYDAFANDLDARRISNTTIPRIEEAFFVDNANKVLLRYLRDDNKTIETFLGVLPEEKIFGGDSTPELTGTFLTQNIWDLSVSPDTKQIFYVIPATNGLLGYIQDLVTNKKLQVFSSPLRGWLTSWNKEGIFVTTKATGFATSSLFKLDVTKDTKNQEKIVGNVYGMATLISPDGQKILYSRSNENGIGLIVYDRKEKKFTDLNIQTMIEKCTWNNDSTLIYCGVPTNMPTSTYPDDWYQGIVSFKDNLWRIDPSGLFGNTELEAISETGGEDIDMTKAAFDQNGNYLYFINKSNFTLWQYNISGI